MADLTEIDWSQVNSQEEISATDQKASENISTTTPVGKFVVTVVKSIAFENTMKAYSCVAAKLKMRIDQIITIEQQIVDAKGNPVKKNGEIIMKKQAVSAGNAATFNDLLLGQFITGDINLYNPKEKEGMKNRRLFVAKKLRLITPQSTLLPEGMWAKAVGCTCIVETERNYWEDELTGEQKENVKVAWSGWDFAPTQQSELANVPAGADTSFDVKKYNI